MDAGKLRALFAQNKTPLLAAGGAGVVALALLNKRRGAGAGAPTSTMPGTIPAAGAVLPAGGVQGAFPDTGATDTYNTIMDQLLKQQAALSPPSVGEATPKPVASTLFAPLWTGKYVRYGNGTIAEVESDGSLYGISAGEAAAQGVNVPGMVVSALPWKNHLEGGPTYTDLVHNLAAAGGQPITNG